MTGLGTRRDDHDEFEELAVGWALHALEPDDEELFSTHVVGCSRCGRLVDETTATVGELAYAAPAEAPSAAFRERLLTAIAETPQEVGAPHVEELPPASLTLPGRSRIRRLTSVRRWPVLTAAVVALLLVVALAVWNVVLRNDRENAESLAQRYQVAVQQLTAPNASTAALASNSGDPVATMIRRGSTMQIVSVALPVNNRRSSTYVLWGLTSQTAPIPHPLGTFDVMQAGIDIRTVTLIGPAGTYPFYAVSREPGRAAPSHPTDVLGAGALKR